jgi:hypothetical protein
VGVLLDDIEGVTVAAWEAGEREPPAWALANVFPLEGGVFFY